MNRHALTRKGGRNAGRMIVLGFFALLPQVSYSQEGTLSAEKISALPPRDAANWKRYLQESQARLAADQDFFEKEMARHGVRESFLPPRGKMFGSREPNNQPETWFSGPEARRIAEIVISFQTPAGGWCKSVDFTQQIRRPGERFCADKGWRYVGTFDNNSTTSPMRFLARMVQATGCESCKRAFLKGLEYLFASQFPNGGWPQVYPLMGGYHDQITLNDGAMVHVIELLRGVASGKAAYEFVAEKDRKRARLAIDRAIVCLLDCQVVVDGRATVWAQQHDSLTLKPAPARAYEMVALSGGESAGVMLVLMDVESPSPRIKSAVHAAAAWFQRTAIHGHVWKKDPDGESKLMAVEGAEPIWARYYQIGTNRPLFGDRDSSIRYDVKEISAERRNGYGWYGTSGREALKKYEEWKTRNGRPVDNKSP